MKKLITTATAVGLLAVAPSAFAQGEHDRGGHPGQGGGQAPAGAGPAHGPGQAPRGPAGGGFHGGPVGERGPAPAAMPPRGAMHGEAMRQGSPGRGPETPNGGFRHETPNGGFRREAPMARSPAEAARASRFNPVRAPASGTVSPQRRSAEIARLRGNVQSPRHFRAGAYIPPAGFAVRRFRFGERLPRAFFARRFFITDFLIFDLFPPPPGFVWVRVGSDALLIDEFTGEIVRVEYGVFF